MTPFREHRLIHYNLADMKDQTRYNSRTAEANAVIQDQTHKEALLRKIGNDSITADPNQKALLSQQAKIVGGTTPQEQSTLDAAKQRMGQAQSVYNNQADGRTSVYDTGTGKVSAMGVIEQNRRDRTANEPIGVIEQTRSQRLADANATPAQRDTNQQNLKGIMNASKADQIEAQLRSQGIADPITIANAKAAAITEETAQMQKDQASKEISDKNAAANASSNAAAGAAASEAATTPPTPTTPQDAGLSAAIAGLPPEYAFLGPVLQAQQAEFAKAQAAQQALYEKTTGTTDAAFDSIDKRISDTESSYKAGTEAIQGLLDQVKEQQSKNIDDQEKAAKDRLAWSELQQSREIERNKVKAVDSKVASLALRGGFGSGAGLSEIDETTRSYENALDDLRSEYGVQRTELGAKFTALHNQVFSDYATNSINNIKDMLSAVERIGQQKNASTEARAKAENDALTTLITNQTNLRQQASKALTDGVKEISTVINESRDDKRAQEQLGWQRLQWVASTYGSNAPTDLLDSIGKQLPGVDVRSVASQMTLAEMKKKGGGSGVGGFSPYQYQGTGQPPTFESFLADKEKAALDSGATKFDTSAKAMAEYRKEYDAKLSASNQNNPTDIMNAFEKRAVAQNLSGPVYKRTQALLDTYIKSGQYEQARDIVDNIGDDIDATSSKAFSQALSARYDVQRLHEALKGVGSIGPITGRLKDLDPYNAEVVRVNNLITQTVPNLARGVFNEVGVLTDADVARYTKTLENPNLTVEQAQNAFTDLNNKINVGMQNQIDVWDAQNKRTKGFKQIFNAPIQGAGITSQSSSADEDFALSILSGN